MPLPLERAKPLYLLGLPAGQVQTEFSGKSDREGGTPEHAGKPSIGFWS